MMRKTVLRVVSIAALIVAVVTTQASAGTDEDIDQGAGAKEVSNLPLAAASLFTPSAGKAANGANDGTGGVTGRYVAPNDPQVARDFYSSITLNEEHLLYGLQGVDDLDGSLGQTTAWLTIPNSPAQTCGGAAFNIQVVKVGQQWGSTLWRTRSCAGVDWDIVASLPVQVDGANLVTAAPLSGFLNPTAEFQLDINAAPPNDLACVDPDLCDFVEMTQSIEHIPRQCSVSDVTIFGSDGPDNIVGTLDKDVIHSLGGRDTVRGKAGDDLICLGTGKDKGFGNSGNDHIIGSAGDDTISGGVGNDFLKGNGQDDTIDGDEGEDLIKGNGGSDKLDGGTGKDTVIGGIGIDTVTGGHGPDLLRGGDGDDFLDGGPGRDSIDGGLGDDELDGGTGDDFLRGDEDDGGIDDSPDDGNDILFGGDGDDTILAQGGSDLLYGEAGSDLLAGGDGNDRIFGGEGADTLIGEAGDDILDGAEGKDRLEGRKGNDVLRGRSGRDVLIGGVGNDVLRGNGGADELFAGIGIDFMNGGSHKPPGDRCIDEGGDDVVPPQECEIFADLLDQPTEQRRHSFR